MRTALLFALISEILNYVQSVLQVYKKLNQNISGWINETLAKLLPGPLLKNQHEVTHLETSPLLTKLTGKIFLYLQYCRPESKSTMDYNVTKLQCMFSCTMKSLEFFKAHVNIDTDILARHAIWSDRISNVIPAVSVKGKIIMETY